MKYIKRFNESDSWTGSLYAYGYPEPPGFTQANNPQETAYPLKSTTQYKCNKCDAEFYIIEGDKIICPVCKYEDANLNESYNNVQEYINDIISQFQTYNIRPVVLNKLLDFYSDEIKDGYENDKSPRDFVDSKVKEMELDNSKGFMQQMGSRGYNQTIKYL